MSLDERFYNAGMYDAMDLHPAEEIKETKTNPYEAFGFANGDQIEIASKNHPGQFHIGYIRLEPTGAELLENRDGKMVPLANKISTHPENHRPYLSAPERAPLIFSHKLQTVASGSDLIALVHFMERSKVDMAAQRLRPPAPQGSENLTPAQRVEYYYKALVRAFELNDTTTANGLAINFTSAHGFRNKAFELAQREAEDLRLKNEKQGAQSAEKTEGPESKYIYIN